MDLVLKDTGLFDDLATKLNVPLEISPLIFNNALTLNLPWEFSFHKKNYKMVRLIQLANIVANAAP